MVEHLSRDEHGQACSSRGSESLQHRHRDEHDARLNLVLSDVQVADETSMRLVSSCLGPDPGPPLSIELVTEGACMGHSAPRQHRCCHPSRARRSAVGWMVSESQVRAEKRRTWQPVSGSTTPRLVFPRDWTSLSAASSVVSGSTRLGGRGRAFGGSGDSVGTGRMWGGSPGGQWGAGGRRGHRKRLERLGNGKVGHGGIRR